MDEDGSGEIEFDEFLVLMSRQILNSDVTYDCEKAFDIWSVFLFFCFYFFIFVFFNFIFDAHAFMKIIPFTWYMSNLYHCLNLTCVLLFHGVPVPLFLSFSFFSFLINNNKNRDSDHDGRITVEQIKSVFQRLPERPTEDEIEELIDMADTDRDGMINFDDLMNMLDSYKPH